MKGLQAGPYGGWGDHFQKKERVHAKPLILLVYLIQSKLLIRLCQLAHNTPHNKLTPSPNTIRAFPLRGGALPCNY